MDLAPGGGTLDAVSYGYDNVDRRTYAKYANGVGDRYTYDAVDQVIGVDYDVVNPEIPANPAGAYETSVYDPMGNRLSFSDWPRGKRDNRKESTP